MKQITIIFLILISASLSIFAGIQKVKMSHLTNPRSILVGDNHFYILEFPRIYIHKKADLALLKTIGKKGEGPGEFKGYANPYITKDKLLVNSLGKILLFSPDGNFINEIRSSEPRTKYKPLGKGYVGRKESVIKKTLYCIVSLYDGKLNLINEIYREKSGFVGGKYFNPLIDPAHFDILGDNIIINSGKDELLIFNSQGKQIDTIGYQYTKVKVSQKYKDALIKNFKRGDRRQYEFLKDILVFPEYWRGIWWFEVVDGKIVVATHVEKGGKLQHLIFNLSGDLEGEIYIPLVEVGDLGYHYPAAISGGKLYQLVPDDTDDTYYLRVSDI